MKLDGIGASQLSSNAGCFYAVKKWVAEKWPFKNVAYPGRDIDWETWELVPEK